MHPNSSVELAIDPAEVAYWNHRRRVWRRQLLVSLIAVVLMIGFVGWKIVRQLTATWWLEANQYVVDWTIDKGNWKQGGSTSVRYTAARFTAFSNEKPTLALKFLRSLHRIEELDISGVIGLRDDTLAGLDDLTSLQRLNLDRSRLPYWNQTREDGLTDVTLARIARLTKLIELNLSGHKITDSGLKQLAGLDLLRSLDLVETEITDAGLEHLKAIRSLRSVDLSRSKVTAQGVSNFEASRPGVRVLADPPTTTLTPATP
jgi:Leucine Rich repeat